MINPHIHDSPSSAARRLGLRTVFVAGPFIKLVDPATGSMPPAQRDRLEHLIGYFEASGCKVFNAHRRERWGADSLEPGQFTRLDFDEISASDLLVAFPGSPASLGTHIELGWASAQQKPIVLLLERGGDYAPMLRGLPRLTRIATIDDIDGRVPIAALEAALESICERRDAR